MKPFFLKILAPTKTVFSGKVMSLSATASDGDIGILADHAPLATILVKGPVRYKAENGSEGEVENKEGFLLVNKNSATVLLSRQKN